MIRLLTVVVKALAAPINNNNVNNLCMGRERTKWRLGLPFCVRTPAFCCWRGLKSSITFTRTKMSHAQETVIALQ